MIAISWVLVIVAVAALVAGIARGGFGLIVAAIAGAVGAAVALGLGLLRTSPEEDPEDVDGAPVEDETDEPEQRPESEDGRPG